MDGWTDPGDAVLSDAPPGDATVDASLRATVTISEAHAYVTAERTHAFVVTVEGVPDPSVTWSVVGSGATGTIDTGGLYTAPATVTTVTVIATSAYDPGASATAIVDVVAVPEAATIETAAIVGLGRESGASVPAQQGVTYQWALDGGMLLTPGTEASVDFIASLPGTLGLRCTVTNLAGTSVTSTTSVDVQPVLTVIRGAGVSGSPTASSMLVPVGTTVDYDFAPVGGYVSAVVAIDGVGSPNVGSVLMTDNHLLWTFGQLAQGTELHDMFAVPADPTQVPYPAFYVHPPALDVTMADPYCGAITPVAAYPRSYLGAFPMPAVRNAPLPAAVKRGVQFKDFWLGDNVTANAGCTGGDPHAVFIESLRRAKLLGADHVTITNWLGTLDATGATPTFVVNPQIPDTELEWFGTAARAEGLDVALIFQTPSTDALGHALPSLPTVAWFTALLERQREFLLAQAVIAERAGYSMIELNWEVWVPDFLGNTALLEIYQDEMLTALQQLRTVFSGTVMLFDDYRFDPVGMQALLQGVDVIGTLPYAVGLSDSVNASLSVDAVREHFGTGVRSGGQLPRWQVIGKPMYFVFQVQSHRDWFRDGWVEDAGCQPGPAGPCIERTLTTDFSVQAIGYEAYIEELMEIVAESGIVLYGVEPSNYWWTDNLLPQDSFPNLAQSIRNKPAESIWLAWFAQP